MASKQGLILGVDCGGTNIKIALVDKRGRLLRSALSAMDYRKPASVVVKDMAGRIRAFMDLCGVKRVDSVGFGIAGDVDQDRGVVRFSPNLGWNNVNLKKTLAKHLPFPILIDNDANCAGWGAYWLDAKKDCQNLLCLTLGTGVGGGVVMFGKLYRGATGSAGELGHMSIEYKSSPCKCGSIGCIESMVGAWGLIERAKTALKNGRAPVLKKLLKDNPGWKVEPKTLSIAADKGDAFCKTLWKDAGERLGFALKNYVNIFNPERIVLCGGLSKAGDKILKPALAVMRRHAFKAAGAKVKVTISRFDENLGVVGAALLSQA